MRVPEDIRANGVQPHRLRLLHPVAPVDTRDARVMYLAGADD